MTQLPRIFIAYARKDAELLEELRLHLKPLERTQRAIIWYDGKIEAGSVWEQAIKDNLDAADIILLLVSANAIASDYFYDKEMTDALARHHNGEARVIPLILRSCTWRATPLAKLQAIPKDGKPVSSWHDRDDAWNDAVEALLGIIEERKEENKEKAASTQRLQAQRQKEATERQRRRALDPFDEVMVSIKGGTFQMGDEHRDLLKPWRRVHKLTVTIKDFQLAKHPVTQAQWRAIMGSDPPQLHFKGCDDCPVESVSWDDVQLFLQKLNEKTDSNYRLPSEAEWEFAARGGNQSIGYKFSGSNDVNEVAWFWENSDNKAHLVQQKKANELGLYDMSGNVWEWCQDVWHKNYEGATGNSSALTTGGKQGIRTVRGGSWLNSSVNCRSAYRYRNNAVHRYSDVGFRLAR